LQQALRWGVRVAKNLEIFCDPNKEIKLPPYHNLMEQSVDHIPNVKLASAVQDTFPSSKLHGYGYSYYLAQMDWYGPLLAKLFASLGGKMVHKKFTHEDLQTIENPTILAAGLGSEELGGNTDGRILAGHLILLNVTSELQQKASKFLRNSDFESYDLSPPFESYNFTAQGETIHGDLYAYLRSTGSWVLGGSRMPSKWIESDDWQPEFSGINTIKLNRKGSLGKLLDVPEPIWRYNIEILSKLLDTNVESHIVQREAAIGIRYLTSMPKVGMEIGTANGTPCLGYYGYGGSGVSCSWGVAIDAVRELRKRNLGPTVRFRLDEVILSSAEYATILRPLQFLLLEMLAE
jgi:hypothetical protein